MLKFLWDQHMELLSSKTAVIGTGAASGLILSNVIWAHGERRRFPRSNK